MENSGLPPLPPQQPPPAPPQQPPGYQQQPAYQQQPVYQPPQRSGMPAWAIVLIVLGVVAALGIGGCAVVAVLVGKTAEKAGNELDKGLRRVQNIDAITNQQADGVELGSARSQVLDQLGPPARLGGNCVFYRVRGGALGDEWQFCFAGIALTDRLTSKSRV